MLLIGIQQIHMTPIYYNIYCIKWALIGINTLLISTIMKTSVSQHSLIFSLLQSRLSVFKIYHKTGHSISTISRIRSKHCLSLLRQQDGHPTKLTLVNITYATRLFRTGKAENVVKTTKSLSIITPKSFSPQTLRRHLKKSE